MVGEGVRRAYLAGEGYISYVSVEHNASGHAEERMLALAHAAGSLARGAVELSATKEALLDLFIEQTFGVCLGVSMQLAFHIGVQADLPAEAMVLELYMSGEMSHTFKEFASKGFFPSVTQHGLTATYGGFIRMSELDVAALRAAFSATLKHIRDGKFAAQFQKEQAEGYPTFTAIRALTEAANPISDAEARVRACLGLKLEQRSTLEEAWE
jgi:ketol-acid reductoisomerase